MIFFKKLTRMHKQENKFAYKNIFGIFQCKAFEKFICWKMLQIKLNIGNKQLKMLKLNYCFVNEVAYMNRALITWANSEDTGISLALLNSLKYEPPHDKNSKMTCPPSEDSDQPGLLSSLIRVFVVCMKKHWALNYLLSAQWRLIRLGGCPGWSESSLGTHVIFLVLSCGGSYMLKLLTPKC